MRNRERARALRATRLSPWKLLGRTKVRFRYDALFADGRIENGVDADAALNSRNLPADAWTTRTAAEAACSNVGPGRWVEYATGRELDEPPQN